MGWKSWWEHGDREREREDCEISDKVDEKVEKEDRVKNGLTR